MEPEHDYNEILFQRHIGSEPTEADAEIVDLGARLHEAGLVDEAIEITDLHIRYHQTLDYYRLLVGGDDRTSL